MTNTWMKAAVAAGLVLAGVAGAGVAAHADQNEQAEVAGVRQAAVKPVEAIRTAEQKAGGQALGFGYESDAHTNAYEVTVATKQGLRLVQVDPKSGTVLRVEKQGRNALAGDGLPARDLDKARQAQTALADAVASAEQAGGGRALEAGYAMMHGHLGIDVDVTKQGRIASYSVDPASGKVQRLSRSETEATEGGEASEGAGND